jgi:hypothetical protein
MKLIEQIDGLFIGQYKEGDTTFFNPPCEKDSDDWDALIKKGYKPEYLPQAEKDAYKAQQEREAILSELSALDAPSYKIERALAGDQQAMDDIKANEAKKSELRAKL